MDSYWVYELHFGNEDFETSETMRGLLLVPQHSNRTSSTKVQFLCYHGGKTVSASEVQEDQYRNGHFEVQKIVRLGQCTNAHKFLMTAKFIAKYNVGKTSKHREQWWSDVLESSKSQKIYVPDVKLVEKVEKERPKVPVGVNTGRCVVKLDNLVKTVMT